MNTKTAAAPTRGKRLNFGIDTVLHAQIKAHCAHTGESMQAFVLAAIAEKIKRDTMEIHQGYSMESS